MIILPEGMETALVPFIVKYSYVQCAEINTGVGYGLLNNTLTECLVDISLAGISIM